MSYISEGRLSDSPYVQMVWHIRAASDYSPVCPADVRWNLLFARREGRMRVSVEGPTTHYVPKFQVEGSEFLVIKFKLGAFMPYLPASTLVDGDATLPEAASKSFWLNGSAWQLPDFDNVESFVARLVRQDLLVTDPVVDAVSRARPPAISFRTVRRRFLHATGLTPKAIEQIERARRAADLLEAGTPILDAAYEVGYADQPHMTRELKRFIGFTPGQIARVNQPA